MGRRGALGQPPAAWRERRREVIPWCTARNSPPLGTQRQRKLLLSEVLGTAGFRANGGTKTRYSTRPSLGRPSQGLLHLRLPPGLAGAWTGWAFCLQLAPRRCLVKGCCGSVGAKAAAGGAHGDEQAERLQPGWKQEVSSGARCVWTPQSAQSPRRVVAAVGHSCMATDRSTKGMPAYPKAAPPSRVVRGEELQDLFRAMKGAFHDFVSSSCTSGKNGTRGGRCEPARDTTERSPPRNHSSSLKGSGRGGLFFFFHTSPTFSAARESIAVISGSGSDNATTPEGGNAARSSSPERDHELMRCTCCLLCSRCDQRQLDAIIACQCPLARLDTLEVDRSLWRDPNFVGHPTWLGVTDWKGTQSEDLQISIQAGEVSYYGRSSRSRMTTCRINTVEWMNEWMNDAFI